MDARQDTVTSTDERSNAPATTPVPVAQEPIHSGEQAAAQQASHVSEPPAAFQVISLAEPDPSSIFEPPPVTSVSPPRTVQGMLNKSRSNHDIQSAAQSSPSSSPASGRAIINTNDTRDDVPCNCITFWTVFRRPKPLSPRSSFDADTRDEERPTYSPRGLS